MNRVVITGMGGLTPLGTEWKDIRQRIIDKVSGITAMPEWQEIDGLTTFMAGSVPDFPGPPKAWPRKKLRTMGRTAMLATRASEIAVTKAELLDCESLVNGRTGVAYGSTYGSPPVLMNFLQKAGIDKSLRGLTGSNFVQFMSHTCAANVAQFFEARGRIIPTTCACASGAQAIGYAYESIQAGYQDVMIAGGSDEMHYFSSAVFDILYATSAKNDAPTTVPAPFDQNRDGLVIGEGAGTLILESLDHAQKRGAPIVAEIVGFGTNCDGGHIVNPSAQAIEGVMNMAIKNAGITPDAIGYVSAHGTATKVGDPAETKATESCFGRAVPISALKSYMGHTLGACGAIEAWLSINMMNEGWVPPTMNLVTVDSNCGKLDYITEARDLDYNYLMSNNFAFGGVNVSLIFKKWN